MWQKIVENKIIMIIVAIVLALIAVSLLLFFNLTKEKETMAKLDELEKIEELAEEYIDINDLESFEEAEEQENEEEQNEINKNETKNDKNNNTKVTGTTSYYIKVNYGAQVVTVYTKDAEGYYTVPVRAMVCSTGDYTPPCAKYSNTKYKIPGNRYRWLGLQGNVCGQYATQIVGNILFHSVPYLRQGDNASLEYWEYDRLGTRASAGCIRLTVKDAKWIFENVSAGTIVEFYSDSNPGPLGKPSAKKISSYPDYLRNWDPTDSASNNPWNTYKEETPKVETPVEPEKPQEEQKPQNEEPKTSETEEKPEEDKQENSEKEDNNQNNEENNEQENGHTESEGNKDNEEDNKENEDNDNETDENKEE